MNPNPRPGLPPSIHLIGPVSHEPVAVMTQWRLFQLLGPTGRRSRHLVGRTGREGRVCSALASLDLLTLTAISGSWRFYRLLGPPGHDPDAQYVWNAWTRVTGATHVRDVTRALLRLRRMRGLQGMAPGAAGTNFSPPKGAES